MNGSGGSRTTLANGSKASVFGGQAFNKAAFPPTKYINGLLSAYAPDITFNAVSLCHGAPLPYLPWTLLPTCAWSL